MLPYLTYKQTIFVILLTFLSLSPTIGQEDELTEEILKLIKFETTLDVKNHPGFIVGIVDMDTVFYRSFGKQQNFINEQTIFEIGSVSKVFTSALISILEHRGSLSMNRSIDEYIYDSHKNTKLDQITIYDLITHQSGFPKRPSFFGVKERDIQNPYGLYTNADLLDFYKTYEGGSIGEFKYSHTNYALIEWIIERAMDVPFEQTLQEQLIQPLQLKNTYITGDSTQIIYRGYNRARNEVKPWTFKSFVASEGIKSTAEDLCTFVQKYFDDSIDPLSPILRKTLKTQIVTNYDENVQMAYGWHVIGQKKHHDIIMHSGRTSGHHSTILMIPNTGTAVVVLSAGAEGTQNLAYELLRMINYNWKRKSL